MRLLPFRRFTDGKTPLAPHQAQARLRNAIAVRWTFGFSKPDQPFVGSFDGKSLRRNEVCSPTQLPLPVHPRLDRVHGEGYAPKRYWMQLHHIVLVLMGFLMLAAGSVFLSGAARSAASRQVDPVMLRGLGVLVFLGAVGLGRLLHGAEPLGR